MVVILTRAHVIMVAILTRAKTVVARAHVANMGTVVTRVGTILMYILMVVTRAHVIMVVILTRARTVVTRALYEVSF